MITCDQDPVVAQEQLSPLAKRSNLGQKSVIAL